MVMVMTIAIIATRVTMIVMVMTTGRLQGKACYRHQPPRSYFAAAETASRPDHWSRCVAAALPYPATRHTHTHRYTIRQTARQPDRHRAMRDVRLGMFPHQHSRAATRNIVPGHPSLHTRRQGASRNPALCLGSLVHARHRTSHHAHCLISPLHLGAYTATVQRSLQ